ncbi:hypothetical protein GPECTOR_65g193 [Gonium pectorale]|uniref:Uncharacterized protein n=1 Tax=Gonium pectorale TaxID=33097 RepID=A0A150G4W5_GONPE|nr:hypothetical protein GPECTOR_65g193 [Gonium pectorale]|eukprot:KXZ44575.1 hypothetical protein GPECTOR_65g193 [Gonium pectorale]
MAPIISRIRRTKEQKQAARRELAELQANVLETGLLVRGISTCKQSCWQRADHNSSPSSVYKHTMEARRYLAAWARFATESIFGGEVPSAEQALLAYGTARTRLAERGRDFCSNVYIADVSPHTGAVLFDHEDYVHKLKNLVSQLRSQPDTPVDSADTLLLSKARILAAAAEDPGRAHVAGALASSVDAQNVPICEALV